MIGKMTLKKQIISQILAILVLLAVIFPVLWIISMAIDPRDVSRPSTLIPPGASLEAFAKIFNKPTSNPVTFLELLRNSTMLAVGVSAFTVLIGTTAAYAFSRFRFPGRQAGMLGFIIVQMLPSVATVTALFVLLNIVLGPQVRNSIVGVGVAMIAGALPFAIWNMKGFIDTIPRELEEAAYIDGASANQTFFRIMLPLALPGLAVTALLGFMAGWTGVCAFLAVHLEPEVVHAIHGVVRDAGAIRGQHAVVPVRGHEHRRVGSRRARLLRPAEVHRGRPDVGWC